MLEVNLDNILKSIEDSEDKILRLAKCNYSGSNDVLIDMEKEKIERQMRLIKILMSKEEA